MQMETPRSGMYLPAGYAPQYPPAAFQAPVSGPPEHTGHPALQTNYQGPQSGYPGPQTGYTVSTTGHESYAAARLPTQNNQTIVLINTQWMPAPPPLLNCPPGLEYLNQIDQILIHQQVELLEVLTGFETNNKFEIKNSLGQMVYVAVEDTDCCTRNCCEASRPFTLRILDHLGQEVMTLERPLRCSSCCFPCCLQEIKSLDEVSRIGKITKQWSGCVKEAFTDADNFGIQFPLDLDVKMKAVMLGACFLIDYMFFEGCE
uniref:Phospholipid scramblase n=2 Tax=Rattus norvegicus TaxID=10116 RepID=A0A8I6A3V8_RAT